MISTIGSRKGGRVLSKHCVLVVGLLSIFPALAIAQSSDDVGAVPRTPWGVPDLQGLWSNSTTTPLERPSRLGDKALLTDAEVAELDAQYQGLADRPPRAGDPGTYNEFWWERGTRLKRTSLIVDPPDGRMPPLTPEGQQRAAWRPGVGSWEDRNLGERCITRGRAQAAWRVQQQLSYPAESWIRLHSPRDDPRSSDHPRG